MSDVGRIGEAPAAGDSGAADSAAVTRFLDDLRALGEGPAPEPSPELAALLAGVTPLVAARRGRPNIVRRVALIAAAVVVGTTLAAANHRLPAPAQRVVSNVVNDLTPFHIDTPHPAQTPTTAVPTTPTPTPTTKPPTHAAPVPVRSSEDRPEPSEPRSSTEDGTGGSDRSGETTSDGGDGERSATSSRSPDGGSDGGYSGAPSGGSDSGSVGGTDGGSDGGGGGGD